MQKKAIIILSLMVVAIIAARVALPGIIERQVNNVLADMRDYRGHVDNIDLFLLAGNSRIEGFTLLKKTDLVEVPFLAIPEMTFGLQWRALIDGEIVADVQLHSPEVNFVDGDTEESSQVGAGPDWIETLEKLSPFTINALTISNGTLRLRANSPERISETLLTLQDIRLVAENFSNVREHSKPLHATVVASGMVQSTAVAKLNVELDPLARPPALTVDASIAKLPLTKLNPLLRKYAKIDAEAGTFEAYVEFASSQGSFTGYAKALMKDADFFRTDESGSFFGKAWQSIVDGAKALLENEETDRLAAKIPLSGELTAVDAEIIPAVFSILENAFVEALSAGFGNSVTLADAQAEAADEG